MAAPQAETFPSLVPPLPPTTVTPPSKLPFHEPASSSSEQTSSSSSEKSTPITETMFSPSPVNNPTNNHRQGALAMKAGPVMQGQEMQAKNQGITTMQCVARGTREYRLISDVTLDTFPQCYFDCTVEILDAFENTDGPHVMYASDYTANPHTYPVQASWCPRKLSAYVSGELWYLPNSRLTAKDYFEGRPGNMEKLTLDINNGQKQLSDIEAWVRSFEYSAK
ncbi:hypothetical protein AZE42_06282 [Rhizopogon vesiculosus]|uniref:Uncharacterized protein n=1 Tax=Rhizopogon vesiculosus TaxID=180088 RepID=A0A1J8Q2Y9_9AGAM|nr:hypothetical protein AZE42_06282 [Rhizopogon vesiculosus]